MNTKVLTNNELWYEHKISKSEEIRKELISRYSNLIWYVIQKCKFASNVIMTREDLFSFGVEGLSEAITRFDMDYGIKFETYAIQRIKGKIIDSLRQIQIKPIINQYFNTDINSINKDGVVLLETMENNSVPAPDKQLELKDDCERLLEAIKRLDDKERFILNLYYYEYLTYNQIAQILGYSDSSRISQLHTAIIKKLKSSLEE